MYCQHCGNNLGEPEAAVEETEIAADAVSDAAESYSSAEVEIARINADRDVTLAKIERGIIAKELEARSEEDAVKAEILDAAMEPEPEPEPVVVVDAPDEAEPELDAEPPEVVEDAGPPKKERANAWW